MSEAKYLIEGLPRGQVFCRGLYRPDYRESGISVYGKVEIVHCTIRSKLSIALFFYGLQVVYSLVFCTFALNVIRDILKGKSKLASKAIR